MITPDLLPTKDLERQCRLFSLYLVSREPSGYVTAQYLEAHRTHPEFSNVRLDFFNRTLLRAALTSRPAASAADAYARILAPRSMLRKKLILLLALLEISPGSFDALEAPTAGSTARAYVALAGRCARFAVLLALSSIFLLPTQLVSRAADATRRAVHA